MNKKGMVDFKVHFTILLFLSGTFLYLIGAFDNLGLVYEELLENPLQTLPFVLIVIGVIFFVSLYSFYEKK